MSLTGQPESVLEEEREFLLRSLRDLEAEHDAGDIDDADYRALRDDYTVRAAAVLRALAGEPATGMSAVSEASEADPGSVSAPSPDATDPSVAEPSVAGSRSWRRRVIIGAVALAFGAVVGIAVVHASSHRSSGEVISGNAVGADKVAAVLAKAQSEAASGNGVAALKDCQSILATDPNQPQALAEEGWLLAQTQRPDLQVEGLADLQRAVAAAPSDDTAHLYRGIVLLDLGRKAEAVPDLQWYLAHDPAPQIKTRVAKQLADAEKP